MFCLDVVSIPDAQKGEQLVLVTDKTDAKRADILAYTRANGISELMVPKTIHPVSKLPVLGTGKTDYAMIQTLIGSPQLK